METMLHTLFLCLAVTAVITFPLVEAGKPCPSVQVPWQCCQNEEICCHGGSGCCASNTPICCSDGESCCPSNFPTCCPGSDHNCCPSNSVCCPQGDRCCPSNFPNCCPGSDSCCPSDFPTCCSGNRCCPSNTQCCGSGCCPPGYPVCCTEYCCPSGSFCCAQGCCTNLGRRSAEEISDDLLEVEGNKTMLQATVGIDTVQSWGKSPLDILGVKSNSDHIIQHSIFSRQAATVSFTGTCNSYEREIINEEYHTRVYRDSLGIRTVGVGFNLEKAGARDQITRVGADYDDVLNGRAALTDAQIRALFIEDMNNAISCAIRFCPQWFSLGDGPKSALADMAFNMGCPRLSGFECLRTALSRTPPDYEWAVEEMVDSLWCGQVGLRCGRDTACMRQ